VQISAVICYFSSLKSVISTALRVRTLSTCGLLHYSAREQVKQCSPYVGKDYEVDQSIIILFSPAIKGRRVRSSLLSQSRRLVAHTCLQSVLISSSHLPRTCRGTFISGFKLLLSWWSSFQLVVLNDLNDFNASSLN
jgi:hypothetical protein